MAAITKEDAADILREWAKTDFCPQPEDLNLLANDLCPWIPELDSIVWAKHPRTGVWFRGIVLFDYYSGEKYVKTSQAEWDFGDLSEWQLASVSGPKTSNDKR
jgi:hypothetical protein